MTAATVSRWMMGNYDGGNCIALDDGEECVCVQSISYSLLCRWFRAAVLPLDRELETALFHRLDPSAGRCSPPAPTGPNTARNVRRKSTGGKRPSASAEGGYSVDN